MTGTPKATAATEMAATMRRGRDGSDGEDDEEEETMTMVETREMVETVTMEESSETPATSRPPRSALTTALKLHLRVLEIHGRTLRVVRLRPQSQVRFSTNYFHDAWHILAGNDGAALLGRLLWGLSFQRHAGTLILIDGGHLVPTPFDADPADPILLIPDGLTAVDDDLLRALKLRLRRAAPAPTTIRWHTFGMPEALSRDKRAWFRTWRQRARSPIWMRERMSRRAGFVCYTAPPAVLRDHGLGMYDMHSDGYFPLAEHRGTDTWGYDGELQTIPAFASKVSAARVARRALYPEARGLLTDEARWAVADLADQIRFRVDAARRRARK